MRGEYDRDVLVSMTGEPINNNFTPLLSCAELNTADSQSILKDKPKMQWTDPCTKWEAGKFCQHRPWLKKTQNSIQR